MAADPEKDLQVALDAARSAGALVRDGFLAPGRHRRKGPHDVVTRLDLACDGEVCLGVIHDPLRAETFAAIAGRGAWSEPDHESCRPRRLRHVADAVISADVGAPDSRLGTRHVDALRSQVRAVRNLGSTALSLTYVAAGRLDGVFQASGLGAVDVAAGGLIAREAGVRVSDAAGGPWLLVADPSRGAGIAAGMPAVHRLLVQATS
jgi:myo-inositol-1(or 4)-monophosphatase